MKIRELFETTEEFGSSAVGMTILYIFEGGQAFPRVAPSELVDNIKRIISEVSNIKNVSIIDISGGRLKLTLNNIGVNIAGDRTEQVRIYHEIVNELNKQLNLDLELYDDSSIEYWGIVCHGYPPFKLDCEYVYIWCKPNMKLTNIDKLIKGDEITFNRCETIVGNVLSLLRIKHDSLFLFSNTKPVPEWIPIVTSHLKGNKDILDCQDELIDAGFKEYAKL